MLNASKDYRHDNSVNFTDVLRQQTVPGLLIITTTSTTMAVNAKSAVTAVDISFELQHELFSMSENNSALHPTPTSLLTYDYNNGSAVDGSGAYVATPRISSEIPIWLIPCYGVILFFAIVGNLLVISTLVQNRRMRTITNVFLLNLAISDILLGVLCMPVTLVGTLLRHFIFGEFLCKLIQFSQAGSVAVSSWTLVAISCERYYAICHPLRSRRWQTIHHAYRIIGFIWFGSIICMTPIALFSQLIPTSRQGLRKCREQWPDDTMAYERSYNIFLDLVLLVLPLLILCVAYILITRTLYVGMRAERALIFGGYSTGSTIIKQHEGSSLEATATAAKSKKVTAGAALQRPVSRDFKLSMALCCCCQRRGGHNGSHRKDTAIETQSDNGYLQQQQQQQQTNYYDDAGVGGDIIHTPISTASSKASQSVFSLRELPTELQSSTAHQQQQQQLLQNNMARHLHGYNNNDNHTGSSSGSALFDNRQQMFKQQQNHLNLRANISQHNSNPLRLQHQKPHHLLQQTAVQAQKQHLMGDRQISNPSHSLRFIDSALRRSNETKNLESKKRVVKMLFVLVLEFFICWTPLYVINTVAMFIGPAIYEYIDYTSICFFQLLAYSSSCCNPITYCFMNAGFRRAFLDTFKGLHLSGSSDSGDGAGVVGIGGWSRRRTADGCGSGVGSRRGHHLSTLVTSESIELTNNAINVSNNMSMHDSQPPKPPQRNRMRQTR